MISANLVYDEKKRTLSLDFDGDEITIQTIKNVKHAVEADKGAPIQAVIDFIARKRGITLSQILSTKEEMNTYKEKYRIPLLHPEYRALNKKYNELLYKLENLCIIKEIYL